jgi:hypothetical protein
MAIPTFGNKIAPWLNNGNESPYNNSSSLLSLGLGLISGKTAQDQVAQAAGNFANDRQMGKTYNKTVDFLKQNNPELAQAVESGALGPGDAYKLYLAQKVKADRALSFQTLPDGTYGSYDGTTGTFTPIGKAAKPVGEGGGEYGLNVIYGTDSTTGKTGIGQVGKDGSFHLVDTKGFQPVGNTSNLNLGNTIQTNDKAGNAISSTPINNAQAESDKVFGKGEGDARVAYKSMASKMPGLESVVKDLDTIGQKATYTLTGQALDFGRKQIGMGPREAAIARTEYLAKVDNQVLPLLRDTFGAAFTQEEGNRLRDTLGDPDKSPDEKRVVLNAFIEQKRRDLEALAAQTGQTAPASAPAPAAGKTSSGISFSVEP